MRIVLVLIAICLAAASWRPRFFDRLIVDDPNEKYELVRDLESHFKDDRIIEIYRELYVIESHKPQPDLKFMQLLQSKIQTCEILFRKEEPK